MGRNIMSKTSDYVAVVRCSECKHAPLNLGEDVHTMDIEFPSGDYMCPYRRSDSWYNEMPKPNWFCHYGERKTEND